MLEVYLTVKTFIMLFGLAFLLLYLILCGIGLFQAVREHREMQKMMNQIEQEEHSKK